MLVLLVLFVLVLFFIKVGATRDGIGDGVFLGLFVFGFDEFGGQGGDLIFVQVDFAASFETFRSDGKIRGSRLLLFTFFLLRGKRGLAACGGFVSGSWLRASDSAPSSARSSHLGRPPEKRRGTVPAPGVAARNSRAEKAQR